MARSTDSTPSSSDGEMAAPDAPNPPKELKSSTPQVSPTQGSASKPSGERGRPQRPKFISRNSSSMIVPRTHTNIDNAEENYPAGDARAMSPRRNSEETEAMEEATRTVVRE